MKALNFPDMASDNHLLSYILVSHVSFLTSPVACLKSHVPCLTSHVSCLRSPVPRLLSHISCLMYPVSVFSVSFLTSPVPIKRHLSHNTYLLYHIYCFTSTVCFMSPVCIMSPICLTFQLCVSSLLSVSRLMHFSCRLSQVYCEYCLSNISLSVSCLLSVSRLLSVSHLLSHVSFSKGLGLACAKKIIKIVQIWFTPVAGMNVQIKRFSELMNLGNLAVLVLLADLADWRTIFV